jgi:hypothetical protein
MLYRAYVDEAGDLGFSPRSSRYFVASAVIVYDKKDGQLRSELAGLRSSLGRRPKHALHFVKFSHSKRLKAVQDVANSCLASIANVVIHKDLIGQPYAVREAAGIAWPNPIYLWALRLLLGRISRCVDEEGGDEAVVTFSQLKGFRPRKLHDYRVALEASSGVDIRWSVFESHPFRIDGPNAVELLQLADITASALFRAIEPDRFGNPEPRYLHELRPKLYRRAGANITSYGLKTFPTEVSNPDGPLAFLRDF